MFGSSFLGARGDALIDIGVLSIVAVVPILLWSWALARKQQWTLHKRVQLATAVILGIVVLLFEIDLNQTRRRSLRRDINTGKRQAFG